MRIVLASGNAGKLREFAQLWPAADVELISQGSLGLADAAETGLTFVENALIKARHAASESGLPALADDSGLVIDALDGRPGLLSARYAGRHGDNEANLQKVLAEMDGVEEAARRARFVCVITYLRHPHDPLPIVAMGTWEGRILRSPRGDHGFGYDPIFLDTASGLSAAELPAGQKNARSHRALALAQFLLQWRAQCR
jgi:XTP/dITP diphosphohydrolase